MLDNVLVILKHCEDLNSSIKTIKSIKKINQDV
jgi:hypothetical protein